MSRMSHLGRGHSADDLLVTFLARLEQKLRKLRFPPIRVGNQQELRWDIEGYLENREGLNKFKADYAAAEALHPEYLRKAAKLAVDSAYKEATDPIFHLLAAILTHWRVVDDLANAFVESFAKKQGCLAAEETEFNQQHSLRLELPSGKTPDEFLRTMKVGLDKVKDQVVVDALYWIQGCLGSTELVPDGILILVRVRDISSISVLQNALIECGAERVGTASLQELEFPKHEGGQGDGKE